MSERIAMRIGLALGLAAWIVAAVLLWRTSVPSLRLGGLDPHQYFAPRLLARAHRYGNGEGLLWLLGELATLAALRADAARIQAAEQVHPPIRVIKVSDWTDEPNAFTAGFGPSTHVVLWDTLLDGRFSRGEIDVVMAHELGHSRSRHILKGIGW